MSNYFNVLVYKGGRFIYIAQIFIATSVLCRTFFKKSSGVFDDAPTILGTHEENIEKVITLSILEAYVHCN